MKIKDIKKPDWLTIADLKTNIPAVIEEWLQFDDEYTFDTCLHDQTVMFAAHLPGSSYKPEVLKIESVEWAGNWQGRHNDYRSNITVWVTAIVEIDRNKIVRLSYDLLDSMIMTSETGCSGSIH